jgi:hypothetical protein
MTKYVEKFEFSQEPLEFQFLEGEPLKLHKEFNFFHNKNKFRKHLNKLQYLFKDRAGYALGASGIRDTYLDEQYFDEYLIVLFTTKEIMKGANAIMQNYINKSVVNGCFLLETTSRYMILIAKDMTGLLQGINMMELVFFQTFEHYFKLNNFQEFVQIRPFRVYDCVQG